MTIHVRRRHLLMSAPVLAGGIATTHLLTRPAHATPTPAQKDTSLEDLGEPVHKTQALSSGIGANEDGVPLGYWVGAGNTITNAEFVVTDLRSEQTLVQVRLPHGIATQRALAVSPVDGTVYFGTSSEEAHLYRYEVGADDVEYLGQAPDEQVWSMAVDEEGTAWFGTYPGGSLFSIDPDSGEFTDHGSPADSEQYVQEIEAAGGAIYLGTRYGGRLFTFDTESDEFSEIDMPSEHEADNIESLDLRGDLLFVGSDDMHVLDVSSKEWVDRLPGASLRVSPPRPDHPDLVYLRVDGDVQEYDMRTGELSQTGWSPNATPESWAWADLDDTGPWLMMTYWNEGRTYGWNPETGEDYYLVPELLGAGAEIISLGVGPDDCIYAGAYLSPPGMGRFDPGDGEFELLEGSGQVEGFGTYDGRLLFGRYPQASVWQYDPSEPWEIDVNPPTPIEIGEQQGRPQVFVELESVPGTVAVASAPTGGVHGGAVSLWRPHDDALDVHRDVVEDQTPVSLVEHEGLLIGGTSIEGGYGVDPVTDEAQLFALDPETGDIAWTVAPVEGATALTALTIDDEGILWGVASGRTVFEFDIEERTLRDTIDLDPDYEGDRYGESERILRRDGKMFVSSAGRLYFVDTRAQAAFVVLGEPTNGPAEEVHEMVEGTDGSIYVIGAGVRLLRLTLPDDVKPPEVEASMQPPSPRPGRGALVRLSAKDDQDKNPTIHYRIGGEWREYVRALRLDPGERLEFRAMDHAFNTSDVEVITIPD